MIQSIRSVLLRLLPEIRMGRATRELALARKDLEMLADFQSEGICAGFVVARVREALRVHDKLLSECRLGEPVRMPERVIAVSPENCLV